MDMTKLAAIAEATLLPPATDGAHQLQAGMTGLEACFRDVGEALAAAIGTIDRMAGGLEDIRHSLSPETAGAAVERLHGVAHRLNTLPSQQRRRAVEVETLTGRTRELRRLLEEIGTILDLLGIYGVNIKIASSGEQAFFDFVTGMDEKLDTGRREVKHITRELDQFGRVVNDVRAADRLLSEESARTGTGVPAELTDNANALQNHVGAVMRTTEQVAGIVRTVQGEVARILGAIQIGDSVRQRAEHCVTILQRVHDRDHAVPPGAVAHVERLVAAQLRAMSEDFRREVDAIVVSLERLVPLADELRMLLAAQGDGDDGQILIRLEQGIAQLDSVTRQLCNADSRLASLTAFVSQTLGELAEGLVRIQHIAIDVQHISANTRLLSRRHGDKGRAVAVIAREIAPCATRLDQLGTAISTLITALTTIDLVQEGGSMGADASLGEPLAIIRAACASSSTAMARGGDEADRIIASLQSSAADLSNQLSFVETSLAIADALSLRADGVPPVDGEPGADTDALAELLPWIYRLYTMACEREIHAPFFLPGMAPATPAIAPVVTFDDDDDGLF
jgi:hypothetical protein